MSLLEVSPGPSIEAIFQAFDGHDYEVDGDTCRVAVYGVHDDGIYRWVQLAVDGPKPRVLTMRLSSSGPGTLISRIN